GGCLDRGGVLPFEGVVRMPAPLPVRPAVHALDVQRHVELVPGQASHRSEDAADEGSEQLCDHGPTSGYRSTMTPASTNIRSAVAAVMPLFRWRAPPPLTT